MLEGEALTCCLPKEERAPARSFNGYPYEIDRLDFRFVGTEGAKLNGEPCRVLPYDPKWDEND
jgi:hypothetical protein